MRFKKPMSLIIAVALLAALMPAPAFAAPSAQANLISNGNFDTFDSSGVAIGWAPWWEDDPKPGGGNYDYATKPAWNAEYNPIVVLSSPYSQHITHNWDPIHAGVRQTISVTPGSVVHFVAYGRGFASQTNYLPSPSDPDGVVRMQIGADPNGGIDWASGVVQWSPAANPLDTWYPFTLDVTAGPAGRVTLFLSANSKGTSQKFVDAYWENVSAVVTGTGGGPAPNAPTPTKPPCYPAPFAMPTAGADGTVIYIVRPCDSLWSIAANSGLTLEQLKAMNGLTSNVISVGQRLIVKQGATPGATPTATGGPADTPTAASTQVANASGGGTDATAGSGTVCAMLYVDTNGNGVRDATEGLLAGGQFTVVDTNTGAPMQAYVTDGANEPHCFEKLSAGAYTISSAAPAGYNATSPTSYPLKVEAGSLYNVEFGAQPSGSASSATSASRNSQRLRTALFGAAGIMFLLLAAGVAGFLILRRPR